MKKLRLLSAMCVCLYGMLNTNITNANPVYADTVESFAGGNGSDNWKGPPKRSGPSCRAKRYKQISEALLLIKGSAFTKKTASTS